MLPIRCSHVDSLFAMQQMETSIQMQAKRANRSWAIEVCQILCNLTDHAVLKKVRLPCLYLDGVATAAQQEGAHIFFRACLCTAGQRFWSMSLHSEIPPDTFPAFWTMMRKRLLLVLNGRGAWRQWSTKPLCALPIQITQKERLGACRA